MSLWTEVRLYEPKPACGYIRNQGHRPSFSEENVGYPHHSDVGLSPRNLNKVSGDGLSSGAPECPGRAFFVSCGRGKTPPMSAFPLKGANRRGWGG